jgi:hypothetical protein
MPRHFINLKYSSDLATLILIYCLHRLCNVNLCGLSDKQVFDFLPSIHNISLKPLYNFLLAEHIFDVPSHLVLHL